MTNIDGKTAFQTFLEEAELALLETAETEAKKLGAEFLPGLIARMKAALNKLGKPNFWQFIKFGEEKGLQDLIELAQTALTYCQS